MAPTTGAEAVAEACPACGRPTLAQAGAGEVCFLCGWADDPAGRADAGLAVGEAGVSLSEAQANVARFGKAYPPSEVGGS